MRENLKKTWMIIKFNMGSLLLFEAGYRIAVFFLVMQLVHAAVEFSLKQQKFSYLTAENYGKFLASSLSVVLLTGILLLILLFFLIEVSALLVGFRYSYQRRKLYASDFLILGVKKTFSFLRHSKISWIFCAALSAPFLTLYFMVREISYIRMLKYTAKQIYKAVQPQFLLYLGITVILVLSFLFVFALPYCILAKKKSWRGIRAGIRLLRRVWKKVLCGFLILHAVMLILIVVIYFLAMACMTAIVSAGSTGTGEVSQVLIYSGYIDMSIGVFAGAVQMIGSVAFVSVIFARFRVPQSQEVSVYELMKQYAWYSKIGRRRTAAVLTMVFILAEGCYLAGLAVSYDTSLETLMGDMEITAHRGGARMAPENTVSALKYSIECGADFAEIDVQETKDGELILLHDNSLKRTAGVQKNVWDMTLAQIRKLDAGTSFHKRFRGEKIPTLEEVLKFCKGKLDLNIEIKYNGKNKGIVNKVVRAIRKSDFQEHCVVTSMNYSFLEQIKKTAPEIRTGYIMTMTYGSISRVSAADFFSVKYTYVDEDFVQEAHALGKEVHAWTVNYKGDARRMLDMGVDNMITDDPVMVRKVQNQESGNPEGYLELLSYALGI